MWAEYLVMQIILSCLFSFYALVFMLLNSLVDGFLCKQQKKYKLLFKTSDVFKKCSDYQPSMHDLSQHALS